MKPAVFKPAARSRSRCINGKRTSAWMPDRKMVPDVAVYLSSRLTVVRRSFGVCAADFAPEADATACAGVGWDMVCSKMIFQMAVCIGRRVRRGIASCSFGRWPEYRYRQFRLLECAMGASLGVEAGRRKYLIGMGA